MRRIIQRALCLAVPVIALAHCGGSSSSAIGGGDDGGTVDGTADGASADGTTTSDGGSGDDGSTGGDDSAVVGDTGSGDDGGNDGGACGDAGTTRAACVTCCAMAHPQGAQSLASDELACACSPEICGGLEAGGAASDAGDLGTGACAAECSMPGHAPGATCDVCLRRSVGTMTAHGPCYDQIVAACESDDACKAYATCEATCPAN